MWATITLIAFSLIGLGMAIENHGKPKKGNENFWITLLAQIIEWSLLYFPCVLLCHAIWAQNIFHPFR